MKVLIGYRVAQQMEALHKCFAALQTAGSPVGLLLSACWSALSNRQQASE